MQNAEGKGSTGVRGILAVTVLLLLTGGAIALQIRYRGFEGPLSNNLLILLLINANFLLLASVLFMIGRSLWKLSVDRRSKVLGAKFRTKLVAAFVSLSIIPTILLFTIGSGIYTRGIERLFSLRLESGLQDAMMISQTYYDRLRESAAGFARQVSAQLAESDESMLDDPEVLRNFLERKTAEYGVGALAYFGEDRSLRAQASSGKFPVRTYGRTTLDLVTRALAGEETYAFIAVPGAGDVIRAVVPCRAGDRRSVVGAIAASFHVSENHAGKISDIRSAYVEYRSSFQNKDLIKLSYRLSFLAVMLTLLLASIWIALRVAATITVPIRKLAEGTVEVAAGNLDYRIDEQASDEVGMLVGSFNRMTADLKHSNERLVQEIANKEIILTNIDAGVVSLDRGGRISTINPAALRILEVAREDVLGRRYDDAFGFIDLRPVRNLFRRLEEGHGRAEAVLNLTLRGGRSLTLRMRVSTLRDGTGVLIGSVITFDDMTEFLRAKNAETWQDVARKIAHEVKNPLTPIKLSAERLRKKYGERSPDFDQVFDESSRTIIQQVDGLKGLLDEFSEFARMPRPNPVPGSLKPVVEGVVSLYAGTQTGIEVLADIPAGLPDLLLDQEQIKRVFINLFKNAIEVMSQGGSIRVTARVAEPGDRVRIEVADNGPGISSDDVSRLFEPYFSRKKKGGGLGLAIVERIIADHHGSIRAEQNHPQGARFIIELPVLKSG